MTDTTSDRDAAQGSGHAEVVAVCISPGGIPKTPVESAAVTVDGLEGDGHEHDKHWKPERAVSIQDLEILEELETEGYAVAPGVVGENLTVRGLNVQKLSPGNRLVFEGGPVLELTAPRKPCFVLDAVHPQLQHVIVGRCGFMARVRQVGRLHPGQRITVEV